MDSSYFGLPMTVVDTHIVSHVRTKFSTFMKAYIEYAGRGGPGPPYVFSLKSTFMFNH